MILNHRERQRGGRLKSGERVGQESEVALPRSIQRPGRFSDNLWRNLRPNCIGALSCLSLVLKYDLKDMSSGSSFGFVGERLS